MNGKLRISMEQAFRKHLQRRYSLRLHMFVILLATTLSGVFFSRILIFLGVADFRVRYPVAVVLSYFVFFACVKLWLLWIASAKSPEATTDEWFYLPATSFGGDTGDVSPSVEGGGGEFSGGGASGSFDGPGKTVTGAAVLADSSPVEGETVSGGGIGGTVGKTVDALGDDNIVVAVIVLMALVAVVLASAVLLLYSAPTILAEAAFQGVLAASLIKRTHTMSDSSWAGSIFKATWKPFVVTLLVAFFAGMVLHSYFPGAVRLMDILWKN